MLGQHFRGLATTRDDGDGAVLQAAREVRLVEPLQRRDGRLHAARGDLVVGC